MLTRSRRSTEQGIRRSRKMLRMTRILAGLALAALAGCSEAHRDTPGRRRPPAPTVAAAAPTPAPPATPAVVAAPAPIQSLRPEDAKGTSLVEFLLPGKLRLGGFAMGLVFDPTAFAFGQPQQAAALKGYICQPNVATAGQLRFNCVGLPGEDRGGLLVSFPVSWKERPPVPGDFRFNQQEIVDDRGAKIEKAQIEIQVVAPPH